MIIILLCTHNNIGPVERIILVTRRQSSLLQETMIVVIYCLMLWKSCYFLAIIMEPRVHVCSPGVTAKIIVCVCMHDDYCHNYDNGSYPPLIDKWLHRSCSHQ